MSAQCFEKILCLSFASPITNGEFLLPSVLTRDTLNWLLTGK